MFKKFFYGLMLSGLAMSLAYGPAYAQAMVVSSGDHGGDGPGHIHDDSHEHTDEELEEGIRLDREALGMVEESVAERESIAPPVDDAEEPENNVRMRYNGDQSIMGRIGRPPRVFNNVR